MFTGNAWDLPVVMKHLPALTNIDSNKAGAYVLIPGFDPGRRANFLPFGCKGIAL
jgi:hypothetical protein